MKSVPSLLLRYLHNRTSRRNLVILLRFVAVLIGMVAAYSVVFHYLMEREGQQYSWVTGVYWTLTVMSTLGFGDITFHTDAGRLFSLLVLLSGVVFLLVLLPFTFIEFFYEPWMDARAAARVPTEVPEKTTGHVVLTRYGPIAAALIERLKRYGYPYVVILPDFDEALAVHDQGVNVMLGDIDDPETYRRARIESAALMATTRTDIINTSAVFAVREMTNRVPVVATVRSAAAAEILRVAGCNRVLDLSENMGRTLARRARGADATSHVIGQLEEVLIAEANAAETPLQGKTLEESRARDTAGVTVVGVWDRGKFEIGRDEMVVGANSVLVLAGSREQLAAFDERCREGRSAAATSAAPVIIIGGGRVGRATARALDRRGITYRIIEMERRLIRDDATYVHGSATDPDILEKAGIRDTPTVIVTTRDDDTNVYVTIYCRRVRPEVQIISRATVDRKVAVLHRAGCDFVYSYASMGANTLFNLLKRTDIVMVAEGLDVFKVKVPKALAGKKIAETQIRQETGCSIVAVDAGDQGTVINPPPETVLGDGIELVLIGSIEAEVRFLDEYGQGVEEPMDALIITTAFGLGLLARLVNLPPLVGFLMAGFALRAMGVPQSPLVQVAADLGVTLLMFTIGLKLKLKTLARPVVWGGTTLHTVLTTVACAIALLGLGAVGVSSLAGLDVKTVLLVAFALSFSSTVFAVKILEENGDLAANYGKVAIGILIMQDLFAVLFLVFSAGAIPTPLAIGLLLLLPARPLLHRLAAASGHGELLVVCGLFLAIVAGYHAFDVTGVKGDLGALVIGVLIGGHPKSKELADALFSVKELLLVGFFVNVGLSGALTWSAAGTAGLLLLILPLKVVLYFVILTRLGLRARGATLATLTLANFSEFGLIVVAIGVEQGWLASHWLITVALALSASLVLASPFCARGYRIYEHFADRLRPFESKAAAARVPSIDLRDVDALVFGMGRVGLGAYRKLEEQMGTAVIGLDHDLEKVLRHQKAGRRVIHGDGIDHELWEDMRGRLDGLPLVVLALQDHTSNLEVMRLLKQYDYTGVIAAAATFEDEVVRLRAAGATTVHNFYSEAGMGLAEHALRALVGEGSGDDGEDGDGDGERLDGAPA